MECENFVEALDDGNIIEDNAKPKVVYTISLGTIRDIVNAPAGTFQPDFQTSVCEALKNIAVLQERKAEPEKKDTGSYKTPKIIELA